jgi:hypothetical protein
MKATKEQMDGELMVIKLFVSNYARDLLSYQTFNLLNISADITLIQVKEKAG